MAVYKKRVSTKDPRFRNRAITLMTPDSIDRIPVGDTEVICNGCNRNIFNVLHPEIETFGWLIYLGKRELKADQPYDIYCDDCVNSRFPKAIEV